MSRRAFAVSLLAVAAVACHRAPPASQRAARPPAPAAEPSVAAPVAPVAPVAPAAPAMQTTADLHVHSALPAGATLELSDVSGDIDVSLAADGAADVRAVVRGRDAAKVRVVKHTEDAGLVVCVLFADDRDEDCRLGHVTHHQKAHDDADVRVDLVARLPRGVKLVAETMNGAVRARGLESDVHAESMNGDIDVSTTGGASLRTMNGAITVRLPEKLDADVEASTMNGRIAASFPMTIDTLPMGIGPKTGRARLGKGGARIEAKTMNGDVVLRTGAGT